MLNERISNFSNIGNKGGLFFVYKSVLNGVRSVTSLKHFAMHYPGRLDVEVDAAIMLFHYINLLSYDETNDVITLSNSVMLEEDEFFSILAKLSFDLIVEDSILSLDSLAYDLHVDRYYIAKKCISLKYACLRNLLISLGVFEIRSQDSYYVSSLFVKNSRTHIARKRKITQEQLLKILEQERLQGEAGEDFVLQFERQRLQGREDLDEIKQISVVDVSAGYDIISYNDLESKKLDRLIEVKTYKGKPHFHWSENEMRIARLRKEHYFIYLVSYEEMNNEGYLPIIIQDPINYFHENTEWESTVDSITLSKL